MIRWFRLLALPIILLCLGLSAPARADVVVSFYSLDSGERFPHAFVTMKGRLDNGTAVDVNYGFTAKSVSPAVLMGSVTGIVSSNATSYIAKADRQFAVTVNDATYAQLVARVRSWQNRKQPSYNLGKANCVHFVMELAEISGLKINRQTKFIKKPKSFLQEVKKLNPNL